VRIQKTDQNIDHVDEVSAGAEATQSLKDPLQREETEEDDRPEKTKIDDELFLGHKTDHEKNDREFN